MSGPDTQSVLSTLSAAAKKLRVLVVEDEGLVAMLIEDMLTDLGHEVAAVASRIQEALQIAQTGTFDLAIIDINLNGQPSYPIAEILRSRDIPFIFATGYGVQGVDIKFAKAPTLTKPFIITQLEELLSRVEYRAG
jgi:CheY-like chemotaxis protein